MNYNILILFKKYLLFIKIIIIVEAKIKEIEEILKKEKEEKD